MLKICAEEAHTIYEEDVDMNSRKARIFLGAFLALFLLAGTAFAAEVALTSVGQSPDGTMVQVIMKRLKISMEYDKLMEPEALTDQKVLIAVVGGSSKGLGAAGIDKDQEQARAMALLDAAKSKGMKILVMHVGGEGRRGQLSDMFIQAVTPKGDAIILVEGADNDGIFTNLAGEGVTIYTAESVKKTEEPLKMVLASWGVGQ
jgi:hypothetical protein